MVTVRDLQQMCEIKDLTARNLEELEAKIHELERNRSTRDTDIVKIVLDAVENELDRLNTALDVSSIELIEAEVVNKLLTLS